MPTRNRGPHPNDHRNFATAQLKKIAAAVDDLCYLLTRGYNADSASQLVGNRHKLNKRQRSAVERMSVSQQQIEMRLARELPAEAIHHCPIAIDGFNQLILLESLFSGAYVFRCRDGAYRDISGVHGSYRRVMKTRNVIHQTGYLLQSLSAGPVTWYMDRPVSNSGRLRDQLIEISRDARFDWTVRMVNNADKVLSKTNAVVISSDGWVLDEAERWFNLGDYFIRHYRPQSDAGLQLQIVDLDH